MSKNAKSVQTVQYQQPNQSEICKNGFHVCIGNYAKCLQLKSSRVLNHLIVTVLCMLLIQGNVITQILIIQNVLHFISNFA